MNRSLLPTLCAALAAASLAACKRSDRSREAEAPAPAPMQPGQMPPAGQMPPPGFTPPPGQVPPMGAPSGEISGQIAALQQATKKNPRDREAWVQLGNLYFDNHQAQQSIDAYAKALELQPNDPNVLTDQGVMYRELRSYDRAVANFEKASQVDPRHVQSLFNLGVVYAHDLRQPQKAAAAWQKVIAVAPGSPQAMQARQALEQLGQK